MKTNKTFAAFGVLCGVVGTLASALHHDLGWTLAGLGATLINIMSLIGAFDTDDTDQIGE
jgi:hypothetical protein